MSNPSFENIDQWLFEYTEGNLSVGQEQQLMAFLAAHPELAPELEYWKQAKVESIPTTALDSSTLKKPIPFYLLPNTLSLFFIGAMVILIAQLGITSLSSTPEYTTKKLNLAIIEVDDNNEITFNSQSIALNSVTTDDKVKSQIETEDNSTTYLIAKNNYSQHDDLHSSEQSRTDLVEKGKNASIFNAITHQENDELNAIKNEIESSGVENNEFNSVHPTDLAEIKAYLNRSEYSSEKTHNFMAKHTQTSTKKSKSSSLQQSIQSISSRFKSMIHRPTALQSTQDPHYHAPMMTGFAMNPAFTGSTPGSRIQLTSRAQWLGSSQQQMMNTLSWDGYINAIKGGLGVDLNYNGFNLTKLNSYSIGLTYSPKIKINEYLILAPAMRFEMGMVTIDQSSDVIGNKIEFGRDNVIPLFVEETQIDANQMWYRDIGLGFVMNTKWFYVGFNANNLGRHENNYYSSDITKNYRAPIHYSAVMGTEFQSITRAMSISAYAFYQNYGNLNELWLGGNFRYKWFKVGLGASTNLDAGASLGTVFRRFALYYNVDYTKSDLLNKQILSHQLSLQILLKPTRYKTNYMNL